MDVEILVDQLNKIINLPFLTEKQERIIIRAIVELIIGLILEQKKI